MVCLKFTPRAENARGLSSSSKQENGMKFTAEQINLLNNAPEKVKFILQI